MHTAPKNSPTSIDGREIAGRLLADFAGIHYTPDNPDTAALLDRAAKPGFGRWLDHAATAKGCTQPVRLRGEVLTVQATTGAVLHRFSTEDLPDKVLYKPCGTRLASRCPSCAEVYRWDTYQLLKAGLAGGKGVPESVATHPTVFVTLTAPSFGPVHTRNKHNGKPRPCRARRDRPTCPHGKPAYCTAIHHDSDSRLGQPLCVDCYDYTGHVVWNHLAGKLWDRTILAIRRQLGAVTGGPVKLRYAKVAEYQRRGVIHLHAILRLDGDDPDTITPPPAGITPDGTTVPLYTAGQLAQAVKHATASTALVTRPHPAQPSGWPIRWGTQVDVEIIRSGLPGEHLTERHVAGYLAKYATKSTDAAGYVAARIDTETITAYTNPRRHSHRLIRACWDLGGADPAWLGLRRWAHMLGFGGHFATKSRRYSTTMTALRAARRTNTNPLARTPDDNADNRVQGIDDMPTDDDTTLVLAHWQHVGNGWLTTADAALAAMAADAARQRKPLGLTSAHHIGSDQGRQEI